MTEIYYLNWTLFTIAIKTAGFIPLAYACSTPSSAASQCHFEWAWAASLYISKGPKSGQCVVVSLHCGFLEQLNCKLLLLNFSGCRDARRENSRKTSTLELSPATGDTKVKGGFPTAGHRGDCSDQSAGFQITLTLVSNTSLFNDTI